MIKNTTCFCEHHQKTKLLCSILYVIQHWGDFLVDFYLLQNGVPKGRSGEQEGDEPHTEPMGTGVVRKGPLASL